MGNDIYFCPRLPRLGKEEEIVGDSASQRTKNIPTYVTFGAKGLSVDGTQKNKQNTRTPWNDSQCLGTPTVSSGRPKMRMEWGFTKE